MLEDNSLLCCQVTLDHAVIWLTIMFTKSSMQWCVTVQLKDQINQIIHISNE